MGDGTASPPDLFAGPRLLRGLAFVSLNFLPIPPCGKVADNEVADKKVTRFRFVVRKANTLLFCKICPQKIPAYLSDHSNES